MGQPLKIPLGAPVEVDRKDFRYRHSGSQFLHDFF